jgi:hypothetical protein
MLPNLHKELHLSFTTTLRAVGDVSTRLLNGAPPDARFLRRLNSEFHFPREPRAPIRAPVACPNKFDSIRQLRSGLRVSDQPLINQGGSQRCSDKAPPRCRTLKGSPVDRLCGNVFNASSTHFPSTFWHLFDRLPQLPTHRSVIWKILQGIPENSRAPAGGITGLFPEMQGV